MNAGRSCPDWHQEVKEGSRQMKFCLLPSFQCHKIGAHSFDSIVLRSHPNPKQSHSSGIASPAATVAGGICATGSIRLPARTPSRRGIALRRLIKDSVPGRPRTVSNSAAQAGCPAHRCRRLGWFRKLGVVRNARQFLKTRRDQVFVEIPTKATVIMAEAQADQARRAERRDRFAPVQMLKKVVGDV